MASRRDKAEAPPVHAEEHVTAETGPYPKADAQGDSAHVLTPASVYRVLCGRVVMADGIHNTGTIVQLDTAEAEQMILRGLIERA